MFSLLATIGVYQDAIMQKAVDGAETQAHIFEYTTALSMSPKPQLIQPQASDSNSLVPVQTIFVLKVCPRMCRRGVHGETCSLIGQER